MQFNGDSKKKTTRLALGGDKGEIEKRLQVFTNGKSAEAWKGGM